MIFKPSFGARLKRGHLLAQGLIGCWIFNERYGDSIVNLVNNEISITQNAASWSTDGQLDFTGATSINYPVTQIDFVNGSAWSIVWSGRMSNSDFIFPFIGISTDSNNFLSMDFRDTYVASYGLRFETSAGAAHVLDQFYGSDINEFSVEITHFALVCDGSALYGYKNGELLQTLSSLSNLGWSINNIGLAYIGRFFTGKLNYLYVYNTIVDESKIYHNPYQMIEYAPAWERFGATAAGGGGAMPMAILQMNHFNGGSHG